MKSTLQFFGGMAGKIALLAVMFFGSVMALAQDASTTTTNTTTTTEEWYANPLYIGIGAVLLVLLIALIARGNRSRN